jgi:hypothetical protein
MERSHLERGFAEIAQNITSFPDGTVAICRSIDKVPAGIKGANANGICMEHLGNFDLGGDAMTAAHRESIIRLNALLCKKFNLPINTDRIVYHHWYDLNSGMRTNGTGTTKSCPGTNFFGGNSVSDCNTNFLPLVIASANNTQLESHHVINNSALQVGKVKVPLLNVRSGPGSQYAIIKVIRQETTVAIHKQQGGWYRISSGNEWVKSDYIELG